MQLNARIKHKRDTASNWATKNPTPLDGEIIIVEATDGTTRLKVGDGSTKYASLPFVDEALATQVSANTSNISTLTSTKVTGVTSATSGNVVVFDGTGGRLIKDSGKSLSSYLPLAGGTMTGSISWGTTKGQGLTWGTINEKTPYMGYCTQSGDGTFVVGSLSGTTYQTGLAIGGSSGNLLWKGGAVLTTDSTINASKVSGTVTSADKANKDASGNVITTTYATKAELAGIGGERKVFSTSDWVNNNTGTYTLTANGVKSVAGVYKLVGDDYVQVGGVDIALDGQSDVATIRSSTPFAGVLDCAGLTSGVGQPYTLTDSDKNEIISRLAGRRTAFSTSNWKAVTGGYEYTVPTTDAVVAVYRLDSSVYTLVDTVDIKVTASTGATTLFSAVAFDGCVQVAPVTISVQTPYVLTESDKAEIVTRCNTYTKAEIDALFNQCLTKAQYQAELADAIAVLNS